MITRRERELLTSSPSPAPRRAKASQEAANPSAFTENAGVLKKEKDVETTHTRTHRPAADFPTSDDLEGQLYWADKHANDLTMAEHNRCHFAAEAMRLRAAIAKTAA